MEESSNFSGRSVTDQAGSQIRGRYLRLMLFDITCNNVIDLLHYYD